MSITAAADTTLQDGREVCVIRANQLEPGDVILQDEKTDLHVQHVGQHPLYVAWVWADYSFGTAKGIGGSRGYVSASFVCIAPRVEHEGEVH